MIDGVFQYHSPCIKYCHLRGMIQKGKSGQLCQCSLQMYWSVIVYLGHSGSLASAPLWLCLPLGSWIKRVLFFTALSWKWHGALPLTSYQWEWVVRPLLDARRPGECSHVSSCQPAPSNTTLHSVREQSQFGDQPAISTGMSCSRSKSIFSISDALCLHDSWKKLRVLRCREKQRENISMF